MNVMKKNQALFFITAIMAISYAQVNAQVLPGTYTTSWAGNTFVPSTTSYNFVQNWANSMFVEADGTIFTNSFWEEGGKELGIYKNGQCVGTIPNQHGHADGGGVTANATFVWASVHEGKISRFNRPGYSENGIEFTASTATVRGLVANATELFASDYAGGKIKVYSTTTHGSLLRSWSVTRPGPLAMDASGNIWVLTYAANAWGPGTGACIVAYSPTGLLLKTVTLAKGVQAKSIAIDKTNNELLVTDMGSNMQIHIYNNINVTPALVQSFGTKGGILSGTKGLVEPLKLNVPSLVGVDSNQNIIVWSNGNNTDIDKTIDADGMGSCVESYTRAGRLNWQMLGLEFVDMGSFDPTTDGADLYTKHEHFTMDYSKPDGQQWTWKGWTLDRNTYANSDIRTKNGGGHLATPFMRRINGNLFMYLNSMSGAGFSFFRFTPENEIAVPCGEIFGKSQWNDTNGDGQKDTGEASSNVLWQYDMFGNYVDNKGDIWFVYDDIRKHTLQSITNGVPIYNLKPAITTTPAPFKSLRRIQYDSDNDIMYLSGYTASKPYTNDWKSCGLVMARYNNWSSGNRTAAYTINLPSTANGDGANMVSLAIEKDYIFVVGVQTRAKVWVYNSITGTLAGTMVPGANIGGIEKTGWCDLVNSIAAFKTSSGQYLVTVEDDGWAKILIYRWCPAGECADCAVVPVTGFNLNVKNQTLIGAESKDLQLQILPETACRLLVWKSLDPSIVSVNTSGKISGLKPGTTKIVVTDDKETLSDTCTVTVENMPVSGIILDHASMTLNSSKSDILTASISPVNALNQKVIWISTAPSIVSVDSTGLIKALKTGISAIIATTKDGNFSDTCQVTVPEEMRQPFGGMPGIIPGKIEAENFDEGPAGMAYQDTDITNNGEFYRPKSEVDIDSCTDLGGGYYLGWTAADEWLKYLVNVEEGLYDITARVACPDGGSEFKLLLDDKIVTTFGIPKTGDWDIWSDVNNLNVNLMGGNSKTLQMQITKSGFNVNYFNFRKAVPVETFKIRPDTLELIKMGSANLSLEILPDNTTRRGVTWTAANKSMITVDALGKVTAKNITGSTYVYAKSVDGIHMDTCFVKVSSPTGIADHLSADELAIQVYPNPFQSGNLTIKTGTDGNHEISIFDISGKILYRNIANSSLVNIPNLALNPGIYIVKVNNRNRVDNVKLVVN
jgi:uncharacterized protein YjdB